MSLLGKDDITAENGNSSSGGRFKILNLVFNFGIATRTLETCVWICIIEYDLMHNHKLRSLQVS